MTAEQEAHLSYIKSRFNEVLDPKYRAGAVEHGGDLRDMSVLNLLDNAILEAVDQVVYLLTARDKLAQQMTGIDH